MPTWCAGVPKNTRSPGWAWATEGTAVPACAWSAATRGSCTPSRPYTSWASPEQSTPAAGAAAPRGRCRPRRPYTSWVSPEQSSRVEGSVPPQRYGTPVKDRASDTASAPVGPPEPVADDVGPVVCPTASASADAKDVEPAPGAAAGAGGRTPRVDCSWAIRAWTASS